MIPLAAHVHLDALTPLGWVGVSLAALAAIWVVWRAVRLTLRPGEDEPDHIKRSILED